MKQTLLASPLECERHPNVLITNASRPIAEESRCLDSQANDSGTFKKVIEFDKLRLPVHHLSSLRNPGFSRIPEISDKMFTVYNVE
jgi:hypothetical protein